MLNPSKYTASEINKMNVTVFKYNNWIPARPLGGQGLRLFKNIKLAFLVFIGKYDVLDWEDSD